MEVAVIGWPARIALLIEESGTFDDEVVEKITEGDDWFVIVHLRDPVAESIKPILHAINGLERSQ
jgi:hypothetical protein